MCGPDTKLFNFQAFLDSTFTGYEKGDSVLDRSSPVMRILPLVLVSGIIALAPLSAVAAPVILPDAKYSEVVGGDACPGGQQLTSGAPASFHYDCQLANGHEVGLAQTSGGMSPMADVQLDSNSGLVNGGTEIVYQFEIFGPGFFAPLLIKTRGSLTLSGSPSDGYSSVQILVPGAYTLFFADNLHYPNGWDIQQQTSAAIETIFTVDIKAGGSVGNGQLQAVADPSIEIDSAAPNASQFSLVFSPGVDQTTVPEPGSLALISGALIIGLIGRLLAACTG